MATKPDLVLLFAHHLAEEKRREGSDDVTVRARVRVSLNGRQPQLLVDPDVDLTKEHVGLLPARWIVPLTTPLGTRGTPRSRAQGAPPLDISTERAEHRGSGGGT
jgi:hypothetical protein